MLAETLVQFSDYLNDNGYAVTPDKITDCLASFTEEDLDCTEVDDMISTMRFFFCTTRDERAALPDFFKTFLTQKEQIKSEKKKQEEIKETQGAKEKNKDEFQKKKKELEDQIADLHQQAKDIEEEVRKNWKRQEAKLAKSDQKFLEKEDEWIGSLKDSGVDKTLGGQAMTPQEVQDAERRMVKRTEEAIKSGNMTEFKKLQTLFKIMHKVEIVVVNDEPNKEKAVQEAVRETENQIESLRMQQRKAQAEHNRQQDELDRRIRELSKASLIIKPAALSHRSVFEGAKNAVQTTQAIDCPPEADKTFKQLTEADKVKIIRYIRDNILKFKTRMTRRLLDIHHGDIDMAQTIKQACRTGGLPMEICKKQKRPGKSNLILILDVSGSCKEASSMMLTFMYLLQEVFPRGCQAYAFVNSLYDITQIMQTRDIQTAIDQTLALIPRAGQYSNYEKPIQTLWTDYHSKITPESIVIMIGDARNCRNQSAEAEFRSIARRAKKTYWLNTDELRKWDTGDSIASTYAKYCKMFEVRTTRQIVGFLDQGMR